MADNRQPAAYTPAKWEPADASAIQACLAGCATEQQQKRAIEWIMYAAAGVDDLDYRTNDREHAFVSGRRFVGLQVRKLSSIRVGAFIKNGEG